MGSQLAQSEYGIAHDSLIPKGADIGASSVAGQTIHFTQLNLQTALRLLKPGFVGTRFTVTASKEWCPMPGPAKSGFSYEMPYPGPKYALEEPEAFLFKDFYKQFLSYQKSYFHIALSRFNFFYDRIGPEDRIIDCMVAFENLLLPERNELNLRLALRSANLIGDSVADKHEIFEFFKYAYDVRSKIAHGEQISNERTKSKVSMNLDQPSLKLHNYLRIALVKLLRERDIGFSLHDIIDRLTNPFPT